MDVTQSGTDVVELQQRIAASPETVWGFFTDPAMMTRWKGRRAELDPRPGGIYRVEINAEVIARGEYVELEPHTRLVITWGWEGEESPVPPGSSRVEVLLAPDGDGTVLTLRHSGLPDAEQRAQHTEGWTHYIARLEAAGAGRDPGPDPMEVSAGK